MGHFGWLRKYYRETSRNMLVPWMVWGIQGMYIQYSIPKAGRHLFSNVFWLWRSHTSSDFLCSQLMFSSWSRIPIYIRMIDPIISKFHPEGVYMLFCVFPIFSSLSLSTRIGQQKSPSESAKTSTPRQLFFLNSRGGISWDVTSKNDVGMNLGHCMGWPVYVDWRVRHTAQGRNARNGGDFSKSI